MSLDAALRLTEVLLSLALIQQGLEHLRARGTERLLFGTRIVLCVLVISGLASPWPLVAMAGLSVLILQRFRGPYNGGSDRMGLLALWCLVLARLAPAGQWREIAFGYLGLQLLLSYFFAGWVKLRNPDWRSGRALRDVFQFSAYPVSEDLRRWADRPAQLRAASWAVIGLEVVFPLSMVSSATLMVALALAAAFHLANACLFGLNRFFWTWLAAYPALVWLQGRLVGG